MAVGHISRAIEACGIPTVMIAITAFREAPAIMGVSRAVLTAFPMGRPLGPPGAASLQRRILHDALTLLETATSPGTIIELPYRWEPVGGARAG